MSKQTTKKKASRRFSMVAGVLCLITLIGFCAYGLIYDYFDTVVCGCLALGTICAFVYARGNGAFTEIFNWLSVLFIGFGFGIFFLNSYPVWADRLNNISMYGSRGTLVPVIAIMAGCLLTALLEVISCFTRREAM